MTETDSQLGKPTVKEVVQLLKDRRTQEKGAAKERSKEKTYLWVWYSETLGILIQDHNLSGPALAEAGKEAGFGQSDTYRLRDLFNNLDKVRPILKAAEAKTRYKWPGLQKMLQLAGVQEAPKPRARATEITTIEELAQRYPDLVRELQEQVKWATRRELDAVNAKFDAAEAEWKKTEAQLQKTAQSWRDDVHRLGDRRKVLEEELGKVKKELAKAKNSQKATEQELMESYKHYAELSRKSKAGGGSKVVTDLTPLLPHLIGDTTTQERDNAASMIRKRCANWTKLRFVLEE